MNKRKVILFIILGVAIAIFLFISVGIFVGVKRINEENAFCIQNSIFSDYSYVVYADYVEIVEYQGNDKEVVIPETLLGKPVTIIGEKCFRDKDITTVMLSSNLREIRESAFEYCDELEIVQGETQIEIIGDWAFNECDVLRIVKVGTSIKKIGEHAFTNCEFLETIGEQPQLEYIGDKAFNMVGELRDLSVPEGAELGDCVLYGSKWLANQNEEFVIVGDGSLMAYNGESEVIDIPQGVTKLDKGIFALTKENKKVREIYIPNTVEELVTGCFIYCSDVTVYIPESVTRIDEERQKLQPYETINGLVYTGNNDTITIVTTAGSTAQAYAEKYGIKCEIVESW